MFLHAQGVRPAGLSKVPTQELADFISTCIESMRQRRPRARQLLKHPYFASIRAEKCAAKLGEAALAHAGASAVDLQQMMQECAASIAGTVSRTSSELAEVQQSLTGMDSARGSVEGLSPVELPRPTEVLPGLEASRPAPIFGQAGTSSAVPSPPRSEIGGQGFVDGGESVATARTARDSFDTASTSHLPMHEQEPSECSGLVAEPVLTGAWKIFLEMVCWELTEVLDSEAPGKCTVSDYFGCAVGDREFCVKGKLMETEDKLNLRLRIGQHTGVFCGSCSDCGELAACTCARLCLGDISGMPVSAILVLQVRQKWWSLTLIWQLTLRTASPVRWSVT